MITLLCVDYDKTLCISSQHTLESLLQKIREDNDDTEPSWLVDLAHSKIFETSKLLSDQEYTENLFHETKVLEKHLATIHGFLCLLKAIEKARYFKIRK